MSHREKQPDDGLVQVGVPVNGLRRWIMAAAFTVFAAVIVGTPIYDALSAKPQPKAVGAERIAEEKKRAESRWSDGSKAGLIASDLKRTSEVRRLALPYWAGSLWYAFGEVAPSHIRGDDGWVFFRSRARTSRMASDRLVGLSAASVAVADRRLAAQGIETYLLLVPRKEAVAGAFVPKFIDARPHIDVEVLQRARALGGRVADLDTRWWAVPADTVYHQIDSHWNDGGALLAAESVAELLGITGAESRAASFQRIPIVTATGDGFRVSSITRVDRSNPLNVGEPDVQLRPTQKPGTRFPDRNPSPMTELALTGTSFSADSRLRPFLEVLTGIPLWSGARPGLGPITPIVDMIKNRPGGSLPKRLIWEIPLHYLVCGAIPLDQLADLINVTRVTNVETLTRSGDAGGLLSPKSKLVPGSHKLAGELIANPIFERVSHPGNGMLAYRVRGQTSSDIQVVTMSEGCKVSATWRKDAAEVVVPVLSWRQTFDSSLRLRGAPGTVVRVDSIELVTDCHVEQGTSTPSWSPQRLDHVVVEVDNRNKGPVPFTVTATLDDGTTVELGAAKNAWPDSRHYFPVASCVGRTIVKLQALSDNPKALLKAKRAPWIAPVAATDSRPK